MPEFQLDKIHEQHFVNFFGSLVGKQEGQENSFQVWARSGLLPDGKGNFKNRLMFAIVADEANELRQLSTQLKAQHEICSSKSGKPPKSVKERSGFLPEIKFTNWNEFLALVTCVEEYVGLKLGATIQLSANIRGWVQRNFDGASLGDVSRMSSVASDLDLLESAPALQVPIGTPRKPSASRNFGGNVTQFKPEPASESDEGGDEKTPLSKDFPDKKDERGEEENEANGKGCCCTLQ